jgi:hypothetical protein
MVLVLAFAPYESRPLLAAAGLFRGMAIQLTYRWAAGRVMAEDSDRAVLLWTVCGPRPRRDAPREVVAVLVSVATGLVLFLASSALLLLVAGEALEAAGCTAETIGDVRFGIVTFRLTATLWRAVQAYRHDCRLRVELGPQTGRRWRIDLLAASPEGSGHGRGLLRSYLAAADADDAEVVLNCDSRNVSFYRHHGFLVAAGRGPTSQLSMVRPSVTLRRCQAHEAQRARLQGHLARSPAAQHPRSVDPHRPCWP